MAVSRTEKTPICQSEYQIGIDLGGTKIEVILLQGAENELFRKRSATPQDSPDNYGLVIERIRDLVNQALAVVPSTRDYTVGVGIPGTLDKESGIVQNANTTWLAGHHFQSDLSNVLNKEVYMDNDANCFTLAEAIGGAGKGYSMVFGIIMGTGCGGGICMDGHIHSGDHGIAGEWGHFSIDPHGEQCFCGNRGCIDTMLTGPGLVNAYQKRTGTYRSAEEIVDLARDEDLDGYIVFEKFLDNFGRSVGGLISLLDPDAIVLGGGLSNISELYTKGLDQVRKYAFHKKVRTQILKNKLGDSAGVFGAAWLGCST